MTPTVNDKTTRPPGVLPANLRYIVLAAIAALVLVTSFFSGHSTKKATETPVAAPPGGATPNQLSLFTKMLEQKRAEAEEAKKQVDRARDDDELRKALIARAAGSYYPAPEPQRASVVPPVDPLEQRRKEREELSLFASNIVLRTPTKEEPSPSARQTLAGASSATEPTKAAPEIRPTPEPPKATGSGKYLPEYENGFYRVYEGTFVETTLANRLDGSFTGPVKCVASKDVRSRNGNALLIPKGSLFFGEAKRVDSAGQTRLAVSFKRLLMPNGYSIDLENAFGLSKEGQTGLKDKVNNHYLRTLGISGAVGLVGGLALYGGRSGGAYDYARGVAMSSGNETETILNRYLNLLPTITIREGHQVNIYVPEDLLVPEYRP